LSSHKPSASQRDLDLLLHAFSRCGIAFRSLIAAGVSDYLFIDTGEVKPLFLIKIL